MSNFGTSPVRNAYWMIKKENNMLKKQKEELRQEMIKMQKLLRPEALVHDACQQMTKLIGTFYQYLETRFEELEDE